MKTIQTEVKPRKSSDYIGGRTSLDGLIEQIRNCKNCVTKSVLTDIIIDRLVREEYF